MPGKFRMRLINVVCVFAIALLILHIKYGKYSFRRKNRRGKHERSVLDRTISRTDSEVLQPDHFAASFLNEGKTHCDSKFISYGQFARVRNILLDPAKGKLTSEANSGSLKYMVGPGFFKIDCKSNLDVTFTDAAEHLKSWAKVVTYGPISKIKYETVSEWTIAISRNHNDSIQYTILDIYNAYLLSRAFDLDPKTVNILFIDGLPEISSNSTWKALFRKVNKIDEIKGPVMYTNMMWGMIDKDSPLNDKHHLQTIPNLDSFRTFFLKKHNINSQHKQDCTQLNLLYLNKFSKLIKRNTAQSKTEVHEHKVYTIIQDVFVDHPLLQFNMKGSLQDTLEVVSKTDVLVSLHREDLVNILFLPRKAVVFELFQTDTSLSVDNQYQTFAMWRNLSYQYWEADSFTEEKLSPMDALAAELAHKAGEILRHMCFPSQIKQF